MVRTRTAVTVAFASVGTVLVGWQFGAMMLTPPAVPAATPASVPGTTAPARTPGAPPTTTAPTTTSAGAASRTITGSTVDTPYGPVQVAVTVSGKTISEISPLQLTDAGGRSVQISNYAVPILRGEVLQSQTAKVSWVSGATYTSEGYLRSLQSALDQLGG